MIIDRILQIVNYEGISKRSFYTKTGLSNGFLDRPKDVGVSKIEAILRAFPYINPLWLFMGQGEMVLNDNQSNNQKIINGDGNTTQIGHNNELNNNSKNSNTTEVEYLKNKIELLEKSLKDKEKLISMLEKNQK